MSLPNKWGWWGEEGGHRVDVEQLSNAFPETAQMRIVVTTATALPSEVTLAHFRVIQLRDWLNKHFPSEGEAGEAV